MTPDQGKKKRIRKLIVFLVVPALLLGAVHYTVSYKIKNILPVIVDRESGHTYGFKASHIDISLWDKSLTVKQAHLGSIDSTEAKTHYNVSINHMYLQVQSWTDVLFRQKICIDSMSLHAPDISIHEKAPRSGKRQSDIHLADVFKNIERQLLYLEVKSFSFQNGSFSYRSIHTPTVLAGNDINFSVRNFSRKNQKGHVLYSEDIRVNIENQRWTLPDGIHTISFKKLNFSGKNQFFEMDSCTVHAAAQKGKGEMNLYTDKFFFNSMELSAMYEKDALLIDTLLCIRPVLTVGMTRKYKKRKGAAADSADIFKKLLPDLFTHTHFNYINIEDGQLILQKKSKSSVNAVANKSNLKIYNLSLEEDRLPFMKTDSILFGFKNMKFVTPDSLFQIVAGELTIINNDLVLRNTTFGPTDKSHSGKNLTFSAPEFRLSNIDLEDLMNKKLKADSVQLYKPSIVIYNTRKTDEQKKVLPVPIEHFYQTLHGFKELIGLKVVRVIDGDVRITISRKEDLSMHMKHIHATILPIHFLSSDSLINIKQSLREIDVGEISIEHGETNMQVRDFSFYGEEKESYADYVELNLPDDTRIEANKLYWDAFDWDLYEEYKRIQIETLRAQRITIGTNHTKRTDSIQQVKSLPDIRIGSLRLDELLVHSIRGKDTAHVEGQAIRLDSIRSAGHFFTWAKAEGLFKNIYIRNDRMRAVVKSVQFNNKEETMVKDLSLRIRGASSDLKVSAPMIILQSPLYSSDFSEILVHSVFIDKPSVTYVERSNKQAGTGFSIPVTFKATHFRVNGADIQYRKELQTDTVLAATRVSMRIKDLQLSNASEEMIQYTSISLNAKDLLLEKEELAFYFPRADIELVKGSVRQTQDKKKIVIKSGVDFQWENAALQKIFPKDTSYVSVRYFSGNFSNDHFSFTTHEKSQWQPVLSHATFTDGEVIYKSKTHTLTIRSLSWQPSLNMLTVKAFSYIPVLSKEEAFRRAHRQFDYIVVKGSAAHFTGMRMSEHITDSIIHIDNILLENIELTSSRDKQLAEPHGKIKAMPTKLIQSIPQEIDIDSIEVRHSTVIVHQTEPDTSLENTMQLENIHALVRNVTNKTGAQDSLYVTARADFMGVKIQNFSYTESYADSLSYFQAACTMKPGYFSEFNSLTVPMASVVIDQGYSEHLQAHWVGNQYAAIGEMHFKYENLALRILNKQDTSETSFKLKLENALANDLILNRSNKKSSVIFFERNEKKQIFNYWLKAALQGVLSSVGVKSNKKFLKQYKKVQHKYHLPKHAVAVK